MLLNCGVGEDSWKFLGLQGDQTSQSLKKKKNQSWIFIGRTDVEAETPILWPPDAKSWLTGKDPGAGKDWGQEEKGTTENEMVRWHHQLNGHGFGWTPGVGDEQGGLVCCDSWGHKESDTTERLNWTEYSIKKNAIMPFAAIWMNLKIILLSEVSQTKTVIILYHLYVKAKEKKKIQMHLFTK